MWSLCTSLVWTCLCRMETDGEISLNKNLNGRIIDMCFYLLSQVSPSNCYECYLTVVCRNGFSWIAGYSKWGSTEISWWRFCNGDFIGGKDLEIIWLATCFKYNLSLSLSLPHSFFTVAQCLINFIVFRPGVDHLCIQQSESSLEILGNRSFPFISFFFLLCLRSFRYKAGGSNHAAKSLPPKWDERQILTLEGYCIVWSLAVVWPWKKTCLRDWHSLTPTSPSPQSPCAGAFIWGQNVYLNEHHWWTLSVSTPK